ncbi:MAG: hypothetical protein WCP96_11470 [Methylococcaceae bacterium]
MNDKIKLFTLGQIKDKPGAYELVDHCGVFSFRLLAKIDTEENLRDAMLRIQKNGLIALVVMP